MRRLIFLFILVILLTSGFYIAPVTAQSSGFPVRAQYNFGTQIEFQGQLPSGSAVDSATLFYLSEGKVETKHGEAKWGNDGWLRYTADLTADPIRAFSTVVYWFEVNLKNGATIQSQRGSLYYEDNRFQWLTRESKEFRVHWYEGDAAYAQSLLDVASLGLENIQKLLPLKQTSPVEIYAYDSAQDMRATLQTLGKNWVGAHTDPDLGVMVVSLPRGPEQRLEMERQIPHELMHMLLYQWLGSGYGNLPTWLSEGLASVAELYPNPDYIVLLDKAQGKDELLPIASLCQSFPRDASGAFLAYAEATSFTRYLHQQYGTTGLQALAKTYADGMSCERGVQVALGSTLTQLEWHWRGEALRENAALKALANLTPWLVVLVLALAVPLSLVVASLRRKSGIQGTN